MPEPDFASQVAALYEHSPQSADDAAFLARANARVDRYLRRRRWVLSMLGMLGGSITLAVLMQLEAASFVRGHMATILNAFAGLSSIPWATAGAAIIAVLVLPVFVRSLIDPK